MMFILEGVVLMDVKDMDWLGVVGSGVFNGVYFHVFHLYTPSFSLYYLNHQSLFVLSRDLVFR